MKSTALLTSVLAISLVGMASAQSIITQWDFNSVIADGSAGTGSPSPSIGSGTMILEGYFGTSSPKYDDGSSSDPAAVDNSGVVVRDFPDQFTGSGTAGLEFLTSTVGRSGITVSFDHFASNVSSRWAQLDYTLDGGSSWITGFWNNGGGLSPSNIYYTSTVDLSSVTGANDNPGFGFRIVSIFSPLAFSDSSGGADADSAYMPADFRAVYSPGFGGCPKYKANGRWQFDMVTVYTDPIPEPSSLLFVLGSGLGFVLTRSRRRVF